MMCYARAPIRCSWRRCPTPRSFVPLPIIRASLWILCLAAPAPAGTLVENTTLDHDGLVRYFDYYVPSSLPNAPVPLVFVLHGGTQSNKDMLLLRSTWAQWPIIADREKFILVLPNGTTEATGLSGPTGDFTWNDCRGDGINTTADDAGFIAALIEWAESDFAIDPQRIYSTGASNGGMMSFRLALEYSNRIAAIAAVVANLAVDSDCSEDQPAHPISVLIMNGTMDTWVPWNGGQVIGNRGTVMSAHATRDAWRSILGTSETPVHTDFPDFNSTDNSTAALDRYFGGAEETELLFHTISGGGHNIPSLSRYIGAFAESLVGKQNRDIEATDIMWTFFEGHTLDESGEGEGEGEGGDPPRPTFFLYEEGDRFERTIPDPVDVEQPIRWYRDGIELEDGGAIHGANSATCVIDPLTAIVDSGTYHATYDNGSKTGALYGPLVIIVVEAGELPLDGLSVAAALAGLLSSLGVRVLVRPRQ